MPLPGNGMRVQREKSAEGEDLCMEGFVPAAGGRTWCNAGREGREEEGRKEGKPPCPQVKSRESRAR